MSTFILQFGVLLCIYAVVTTVFCMWARHVGDDEKGQQRVQWAGTALMVLFFASAIGLNGWLTLNTDISQAHRSNRISVRELSHREPPGGVPCFRGSEESWVMVAADFLGKEDDRCESLGVNLVKEEIRCE